MEERDCPFCSERILKKAKKCKHCGEFLDKILRKEASEKQNIVVENKTSGLVTFMVVLIIICLLVALTGF